jgi:hypothetical protein
LSDRFASTVIWISVVFVAAVLILVLITSVWPHDAPAGWAYDKNCCGNHDCHPIACERIVANNGGFEYRDYAGATYFFTRDKMKPSQDEQCHVCLHRVNSWSSPGERPAPLCLYLPVRM